MQSAPVCLYLASVKLKIAQRAQFNARVAIGQRSGRLDVARASNNHIFYGSQNTPAQNQYSAYSKNEGNHTCLTPKLCNKKQCSPNGHKTSQSGARRSSINYYYFIPREPKRHMVVVNLTFKWYKQNLQEKSYSSDQPRTQRTAREKHTSARHHAPTKRDQVYTYAIPPLSRSRTMCQLCRPPKCSRARGNPPARASAATAERARQTIRERGCREEEERTELRELIARTFQPYNSKQSR